MTVALRDRVWLSRAEYRRRVLLVWLVLAVPLVLALGFAWQTLRGPSPGRVQVYDAATHRKLWSRTSRS